MKKFIKSYVIYRYGKINKTTSPLKIIVSTLTIVSGGFLSYYDKILPPNDADGIPYDVRM